MVESDQTATKLCPICHEDIDFFAYGACNHPTCTKCILKLRKFGSVDEPDFSKCPTCRRNLNKIVIMESFVPFDQVNTSTMRHDDQYDFSYPSQHIERHYRDMLRSICPVCGEEKISLSALNRHTTMEHQLSYCDLCIRYARLLPCEFVPMKPADLVAHRKWDNKRKRGHPLCNFCKELFYEFEDLIHHLRDSHFLCDLCRPSGEFVVFREQCELLTHYGESHHLCMECRQQQRISCFSTAENLGLHRFQEHPDAVNNDPNSWLPISIELAPSSNITTHRRRDPLRQGIDCVGGVLNSTDGRLIAEGTQAGVRFRRPNPSEWTGDDFPALASSGAPGSHSPVERNEPTSRTQTSVVDGETHRQTESARPGRPSDQPSGKPAVTLAALTGKGRSTRLTADDFPSLSGSANTTVATPQWIKTSSDMTRPRVSHDPARQTQPRPKQVQKLPTASDFPDLPHESGRAAPNHGLASWVVPDASRSAQPNGSQPISPSVNTQSNRLAKQTPPTAADFPDLPGSGPGRSGSGAKVKSASSNLPSHTSRSGVQPSESKRSGTNRGRAPAVADAYQFPTDLSSSAPHVLIRSRQHRNADIRFGLTETLAREDDELESERNRMNHIQVVDVLPDSNRSPTDSSVVHSSDPVDWGPEEFPTLTGPEDSKVTNQPSTVNKQTNSGRKQTGPKKPAKPASQTESLVPKTLVEKNKNSKVKKPSVPSIPGIPRHDWIDTECVLFATTPYVPLPEEEARNRELIRTVELELSDVSGKTGFTRFADLSRRYRHKQLTANAYVEALVGLLTPRSSGTMVADSGDAPKPPLWIAPMLALLPDVGLQRALLRVLQGQGAPKLPQELLPPNHSGRGAREPMCKPPSWAKSVLSLVQCCRTCGQVCLRTDMKAHLNQAHS